MDLLTTLNDLILLITKALPSDEQRLAAFKIRSPKIYARIKKRLLNAFVRYCKNKFWNDNFLKTYGTIQATNDVTDYVMLETDDLPATEQQLFITLTLAELKKA